MSKGNHIDIFTRNSSQRSELVEIHLSSASRQKKTRIMMDFCRRWSYKEGYRKKNYKRLTKVGKREEWVGGIGGRREERVSCRPKEYQQNVQKCHDWHKQCSKIEGPNMSTHNYIHLISTKISKAYTGERHDFSKKLNVHIQNNEIRPLPITLQNKNKTKFNSKWIKNLNVKPKTLKLFQGNTGSPLQETDVKEDFVNRTQLPMN